MHILAFTDIHGVYDRVAAIIAAEAAVDVVVIGGDLTTNGSPQEATGAIERFRQLGPALVAVAGNMDRPSFEASFTLLGVNINGRGTVMQNVGFFGVAASPFTPMHTPYEITEEEIRRRADAGWNQVQAARWKVFVPHAPPHDTRLDRILLGRHVGSRSVREFVESAQPDLLICGHIHEARGIDRLGETQMVNCGAAAHGYFAAIDIDETVTVTLREQTGTSRSR